MLLSSIIYIHSQNFLSQGFLNIEAVGCSAREGVGRGNISDDISKPNGGAGYGGKGGNGYYGGRAGNPYGNISIPLYTGSGGGSHSETGGYGGGLIIINSSTIQYGDNNNCIILNNN